MIRQSSWLPIGICLALLALAVPASTAAQGICRAAMGGEIANVHYEADAVYWEPLVEYDQLILRVSTPCDAIEKVFERGETPFFELREVLGSIDGDYGWELRVVPAVDPAVREVLSAAHETGDYSMVRKLQEQGLLPAGPSVEGSGFAVVEGRIVPPEQIAEKSLITQRSSASPTGAVLAPAAPSSSEPAGDEGNGLMTKDALHYDDVIITGSLCVGFDCVNGESFGYDTIKLKENNLRLYFEDTSVGSFPSGDWRIRINDTTSGGASYFAIDDATNGRTPFQIEAGAPDHALYVEDYGRVGLGTSVPYVELHIVDGDTPTVRLDQDGSSGWATQRWDMAGNETNFFIRDVTNGSKMPVRIQPNAPSNSFSIRSDGDVGLGTWSPEAKLHVENGSILVQNTSNPGFSLQDDSGTGASLWDFELNANGLFQITKDGSGGAEVLIRERQDPGGLETMDVDGSIEADAFNLSSSRTFKTGFEPVDAKDVLARVVELPVSEWTFQWDAEGTRHIGPMAEDFMALFNVGNDSKNISVGDAAGVALAAIQGLHEQVREKDARIEELTSRQSELESELADLRALVQTMQTLLEAR